VAFGPWFDPALRVLRSLRVVRGTALDPFGRTEVRRVERSLHAEYRSLVQAALPHLAAARAEVLAACHLPEGVRGYEDIKLARVREFRIQAAALRTRFGAGPSLHGGTEGDRKLAHPA
jgi:indolepyruvate ferredoxin oxidoreductase